MIRIGGMIFIGVILLLCNCSAFAEDGPQYKYKCDDGRIFTISFIKEKGESIPSKARLVFSKSKTTEILENTGGASGIHYGNEKYLFNEQRGNATLDDFTKPNKGNFVYNTPCREIK